MGIQSLTWRVSGLLVSMTAVGLYGCGSSKIHSGDGGTGADSGSATGSGGSGGAKTGAGGSAGTTGAAGKGGGPHDASAPPVDGAVTCTPGVQMAAITNCGYPYASSNPLTSVVFNEDEVLRAIQPSGASPNGIVKVFYDDEHALTLGVHRVVVKTAAGSTMTDFPVSPLTTDPASVTDPQTGTNDLAGDNSGLDQSLRPMWPVMFITDITDDPNSRAGDWQQGGRPTSPNAVFGSWKGAIRTVDKTVMPNLVTITPDADPAKNKWNLAGGDPAPAALTDQGFGAEARWNVPLAAGRNYRIQVIVHDGDQNKAGGDSGEACVVFCAGGTDGGSGAGGAGGGPPPSCPAGSEACGPGGIDPSLCPAGSVCANGCCLMSIVP